MIRALDQINNFDMESSFNAIKNKEAVFKAGQGAGASGSFFFFSSDNKYIIKTINSQEKKVLFGMLDKMIEYFKECDNFSLLARIYGVFTLKTNIFSPLDVIVMQNTIKMKNLRNQRIIFDLKGSTIKRYVNLPKDEKFFWKSSLNHKRVLKDLNFLEIERSFEQQFVQLETEAAHKIAVQLEKDAEFLS